jgi:Leucine-rich repeat (LRR) protein
VVKYIHEIEQEIYMNNTETLQTDIRKSSRRKYIIAAVALLLLLTPVVVFMLLRSGYDQASEAAIRKAAAVQLGKEPNELTETDFAQVTELNIGAAQTIISLLNPAASISYSNNELADIRLLAKFTNLQKLNLGKINVPEDKIPQWIKTLAKMGIYDIDKGYTIDLRPLEKLAHLEELKLGGAAVSDIQPLAGLNLKHLLLVDAPLSDITPLMKLNQLQTLEIMFCPNIKIKDVEDLKKMYPNLEISGTVNLLK